MEDVQVGPILAEDVQAENAAPNNGDGLILIAKLDNKSLPTDILLLDEHVMVWHHNTGVLGYVDWHVFEESLTGVVDIPVLYAKKLQMETEVWYNHR
jgi:hypothetical protein